MRRVGGRESEQWQAGMELARQGDIANLRVVALDIVSAPADGAARYVQHPRLGAITPRQGNCSSAVLAAMVISAPCWRSPTM